MVVVQAAVAEFLLNKPCNMLDKPKAENHRRKMALENDSVEMEASDTSVCAYQAVMLRTCVCS